MDIRPRAILTRPRAYSFYDVSMDELLTVQHSFGNTFRSKLPLRKAIKKRRAYKDSMRHIWQKMTYQAIQTFHHRTRCPKCDQTPLTSTSYFHMNHQLPRNAYTAWKALCARMQAQFPEILHPKDWLEYLGELRFIEMWYWEGNTASLSCGRMSWNGSLVESPAYGPSEKAEIAVPKIVVSLPKV
ncbi:hypothetical protein B2J93_4417 [Marssonina coronariae]|uniref:Uncharacterized protein n=1 Tax=Diplocarpon coronariae TaxID=2795749 RepID=A0A218Z9I5_9HELO|nr:hypothetical protein B2J93_4417 [Marssonina coronariae]